MMQRLRSDSLCICLFLSLAGLVSCVDKEADSEPMYIQVQEWLSGQSFVSEFAPADLDDDFNPTRVAAIEGMEDQVFRIRTNILINHENQKFSYTLAHEGFPFIRADSVRQAFESFGTKACVIDSADRKSAVVIFREIVDAYNLLVGQKPYVRD